MKRESKGDRGVYNKSVRRVGGGGRLKEVRERNENMGKSITRNRRQPGERACSSRLSRDSKAHLHCVTGLFSATATLLRVIKPACVACRYSLTFAPSTDRLADFYFSPFMRVGFALSPPSISPLLALLFFFRPSFFSPFPLPSFFFLFFSFAFHFND